jgi:hypothetical protein
MGLLSLFKATQSSRSEMGELSRGTNGALWRKAPFMAFSAGEDLQVVYERGSTPQTLPSFVMDFVLGCHQFQPLQAHVANHATSRDWNRLQVDALEDWLPQLIEAGVLISSDEVRKRCAAMREASTPLPPRISSLGFPTGGDRVEILTRAVTSFAQNLREHRREADFVVADNSVRPAHRDLFQQRLRQLQQDLGVPILYSGDAEKRVFAEALVKNGCDPQAVEFGLFDPLRIGFACGANRNALLLQGAGEMICSIDDDVVCRLAASPEAAAKLSLFSDCDPYERWQFRDLQSAFDHASFRPADFLC